MFEKVIDYSVDVGMDKTERKEMNISTQDELLHAVEKSSKIIIYGKSSLVRILLRLLENEGKKSLVHGVRYTDSRKKGEVLEIPVRSLDAMAECNTQADVFLVVSSEEKEASALKKLNEKGFSKIHCIDYDLMAKIGSTEHVHLDFICVGYVKCGTTSLQATLMKNSNIYLPKKKETLYMGWRKRYDDAPKRFNQIYYSGIKEGKIVGNIEPSYHGNAEGIYECFGKDTKIIFMVRNPMDATYSYFKMLMRKTEELKQINYYKKYHKFDLRMFDDYISDYILSGEDTRFCYMNWINRYLRFYEKDQIKVVFFEDVIKEPEKTLNEIQEFVGAKAKAFPKLPHSNEGKAVSKNYISARINRWLYRKDRELRAVHCVEDKKKHNKRKAKLQKYTLKENHDKMLPSSRETLEGYYMDSIHELEQFCGRNLKGMWY